MSIEHPVEKKNNSPKAIDFAAMVLLLDEAIGATQRKFGSRLKSLNY